MRAMVVTRFGGPEVLEPATRPPPVPQAHDLLVQVHTAAVNPVDFKIRQGAFGAGRELPLVLGFDVCGTVRGTGEHVTDFSEGDVVYASPSLVRDGANAEFVCLDGRTAAPKPQGLDDLEAAALPLVTITAWEALYERANVAADEVVLVQGGAGGVGHVAIQLAARRGCRVLTTASRDESIEFCRGVGAHTVINHRTEDVVARVKEETAGRGCEVVFDCVGGSVFDDSARCVAVNGRMISIATAGPAVTRSLSTLFVQNATLHFEMMGAPTMHGVAPDKQGRLLRDAAAVVEAGELKVHVSRTFELEQLAEAHRRQESGRVTGKLGIRVGP